MKKLTSFLVVIVLGLGVAIAAKSPKVTLVSKQYKEIKYVDKRGRIRTKLKNIDKVVPGDTIVYKNIVSNFENKPLKHLVLNNKVPEYTKYIRNSAHCSSKCKVLVSIDGGKTFVPEQKVGKYKKVTNVRWILLSNINPNKQAYVSYKTKIQ
ncbi:MAG: hypothetical protein GXO30_05010 [Epsilonproteobacteria bacterium]|nr:hypothetical protein [Campylobacterota bacterium]